MDQVRPAFSTVPKTSQAYIAEKGCINIYCVSHGFALTIALIYGSLLKNSGVTCCSMNCSMLFFTSGCRMINGPKAAVMLRAPNLCGADAFLGRYKIMMRFLIIGEYRLTIGGYC